MFLPVWIKYWVFWTVYGTKGCCSSKYGWENTRKIFVEKQEPIYHERNQEKSCGTFLWKQYKHNCKELTVFEDMGCKKAFVTIIQSPRIP